MMGKFKDEATKRQFVKMLAMGHTQKQAAKEIGVSERTASIWKKNLPFSHYLTIRDGLQKRIEAMIENENTPAIDIYNLCNSLAAIQKTIDRYTDSVK